MSLTTIEDVASYIVSEGKGFLAADESTGTIGKRFDAINTESTVDSRRDYRELFRLVLCQELKLIKALVHLMTQRK